MKRPKKLWSILLVLVMVLSMMPALTRNAQADEIVWTEVSTQNAWEIQQYLRMEGDVCIKLTGDAEWMLEDADYEPYLWKDRQVWAKLGKGTKILDLNGYRLYLSDKGNAPAQSVMMVIPEGASLNVYDDVGTGMIWMDGQMKFGDDFYGDDAILVRDVFAVTGGLLAVHGGEIHAGRAKRVWCNLVSQNTPDWDWGDKYSAASAYSGYATKFNSGTAVTVESGEAMIYGGEFWGRGWDNISIISRVPNNGAGADGHRDRCAAMRVLGDGKARIYDGSFYGRSDADAIQVEIPSNVIIEEGTFDVSTNDWLVTPLIGPILVLLPSNASSGDRLMAQQFDVLGSGENNFEVTEGWLGSYEVPRDSIAAQSEYYHNYDEKYMLVGLRDEEDYFDIIDQVDLDIVGPLAYETAVTDINEVYRAPAGCTVKSVTWYENGKVWENPGISYFKEGYDYSVAISLYINDITQMKFQRELSSATINGIDAMVLPDEQYGVNDRTQAIILMADFGPCKAPIEEVSINVSEPLDGHTIDYTVMCESDSYLVPIGSDYTRYRRWFVSNDGETDWRELGPGDRFEAGKYYRLSVDLMTVLGEKFAVKRGDGYYLPDVDAKVNGQKATVTREGVTVPAEYIIVRYDFGKCPETIDFISLNAPAKPKEGEVIRYNVSSNTEGCHIAGGGSNITEYCRWLESYGDGDWRVMSPGETFKAGCYYRFQADVVAEGGYAFAVYDDGTSIRPYVQVEANGGRNWADKVYDQDPTKYITAEVIYGLCNDSVIERIMVEDVTAPVVGEKPSYSAIVMGNGYRIDGSRESYYDDWQNDRKLYYVRNGIAWYDVTADKWVYENDTFLAGHEYELTVYLVTEEDYHFLNVFEHDAFPTATVNGEDAIVNEGWSNRWEARVHFNFTAQEPEQKFEDVPTDSYYAEAVAWAVENGITTGATEDTFNPQGQCLRAHAVTFLHRAAGSPVPPTDENPFTDVKETDFFYKPVLWAVHRGITNGINATEFGTYNACSRAAVVTFLWRNAGSPEPKSTKNPFVDVKTGDFFYKPVLWAVENGITNGVDATHFGPSAICKRAQVVTFLYRAYN